MQWSTTAASNQWKPQHAKNLVNRPIARTPTTQPATKNTIANDKRMVFPSHCPPDAVLSDMTQSNSSSTPHMQRVNATFISTDTNKKIKPDASAKGNIRPAPSAGQYGFNVHFDDGPHDVASSFRKSTYPFKISVVVSPNTLLSVESLLHTGASLNIISKRIPSTSREGLTPVDQIAATASGEL